MSSNNTLGAFWPPRGWDRLSFLKKLSGQALHKDIVHATITGLYYKIDPVPVYLQNNKRSYVYRVNIEGWDYSIQNDSREYHVLSFDMSERFNKSLSKDYFISNIKTQSHSFALNQRSASRAYMAAVIMMRQIDNGQVPDYERILRLHKIHPSHRNLYVQEHHRENSLNCGLGALCGNVYYNVNNADQLQCKGD